MNNTCQLIISPRILLISIVNLKVFKKKRKKLKNLENNKKKKRKNTKKNLNTNKKKKTKTKTITTKKEDKEEEDKDKDEDEEKEEEDKEEGEDQDQAQATTMINPSYDISHIDKELLRFLKYTRNDHQSDDIIPLAPVQFRHTLFHDIMMEEQDIHNVFIQYESPGGVIHPILKRHHTKFVLPSLYDWYCFV